jgi:anthranilate synthase component 1
MYSPSREEFYNLARQGNLIPVYREILADMETPVSAFCKIDDRQSAFLLESIAGGFLSRGRFRPCLQVSW